MSKIEQIQFNPEIIYSNNKLKQFFSGEDEIEAVCTLAKKQNASLSSLYLNRWQVTKIVLILPFVYLKGLAIFLFLWIPTKLIGAKNLHRKYAVLLVHTSKKLNCLIAQKRYGMGFIGPSVNTHKKDSTILFNSPSIPYQEAIKKNPSLKHLKPNGFNRKKINFYHKAGICHGMVLWAAFLLLSSKKKVKDPIALLKAIVKLTFKKGAPIQAAIAQNFTITPNLEVKDHFTFKNIKDRAVEQETLEHIKDLPSGVYEVVLVAPSSSQSKRAAHALLYYKSSDEQLNILIDPNSKAVAFNTAPEKILNFLRKHNPTRQKDQCMACFRQLELSSLRF